MDGLDLPVLVDTDERRGVATFRGRDGRLVTLRVGDHDAGSGMRLDMVGASVVIVEHVDDRAASHQWRSRLRIEREVDGGRVTRTTDRPPPEETRLTESWRIDACPTDPAVSRKERGE